MALLDEILAWSQKSLSFWQQDAVRRLFVQQDLSAKDLDDLYVLLKAAHGLPNPDGLKPTPLAKEHLPSTAVAGQVVQLGSIRDLKFVNRIAPGQALKFSQTGITVIYGGNGSGKSGYSRVLKKACRARDQLEEVLPDATDAIAQKGIPEATFDVLIDGAPSALTWSRAITPPEALSNIAVFDARCARVYLSAEQSVAYLPYGLDVVESLANKVLPALTERLNKEVFSVSTDVSPFKHLLGDTAVGKLVASLGPKTNQALVSELANLKPEEEARLVELDKTLAESDPKAKAKEMRIQIQRLDALINKIDGASAWVSDPAISKLKDLDVAAVNALQAEKVAAEKFRSGETLLHGTGDAVWMELFEAARRYSTEMAYPAHEFPHVDEGASCVLCQQPLVDGASRLKRFDEFIKQDAAKAAAEKRRGVASAVAKINGASVQVGLDDALRDELANFNEGLPVMVGAFEMSMEVRRQAMLTAISSHDWTMIPVLALDPRQALKEISAMQAIAVTELEKAGDEAKRKALEREQAELRARTTLAPSAPALIALIERFKLKAQLEQCKSALKTTAISNKSKEFSSSAVTAALQKALQEEFQRLGVGHIGTKLEERSVKGKTKYRLLLNLPVSNNIENILSEGEQRAIAIGSFMAELQLAGHKGAIIFDDPVSSLDHWRRKYVAQRLVNEANCRQVIVLTHDTSFLGELRDAIERLGTDHLIQHLEWSGGKPGFVSDGLPWEHQGYKERINKLEQAQKNFEKLPWPPYPNDQQSEAMRRQYSQLRSAIERVVQDVVFCGVVKRYRDWIRMDNLEGVVGFSKQESAEIARLHKRCCDVTDAHDPSSAKASPVPTAAELGKDIQDLQAVISLIETRKKANKP